MREILFRVYDLDSKKYLKGDFSIGVESSEIRGKYGGVFENLIIEQYTGLTDRNGVKIFEGDFLATGHLGFKCDVTFKDGCFQLILKNSQGNSPLTQTRASRLEIIGNIHENNQ